MEGVVGLNEALPHCSGNPAMDEFHLLEATLDHRLHVLVTWVLLEGTVQSLGSVVKGSSFSRPHILARLELEDWLTCAAQSESR